VLPHIEIIKWEEDVTETFNSITRNMYISPNSNVMYGTFIIPLMQTKCSTLFRETGKDGITPLKCKCVKDCSCAEPVKVRITENKNCFYLSDLEPIDIFGEPRLNMYVHFEYRSKTLSSHEKKQEDEDSVDA
jgi:hypothetical protein